jgi:hypothetical protein
MFIPHNLMSRAEFPVFLGFTARVAMNFLAGALLFRLSSAWNCSYEAIASLPSDLAPRATSPFDHHLIGGLEHLDCFSIYWE